MTAAPREHSAVAIFATRAGAEAAIKTLNRSGVRDTAQMLLPARS